MARINISRTRLLEAATGSSDYHRYTFKRAQRVVETAKEVFNTRQRHDNEGRTSETTPPKYIGEFFIERRGRLWFVGNSDPAALWVEFGAHAGGRTPVLKYRPLTNAVDIVAREHGG